MGCGGVAMAMANRGGQRGAGGRGGRSAIIRRAIRDPRPETKDQGSGCQLPRLQVLTTYNSQLTALQDPQPPRPKTQIATSRAVSRFSSYLAAKRPKT
jgi:hypothetical protein